MLKNICKVILCFLFIPSLAFAQINGLYPPMEIEPELLTPEIEGMVFVKGGCFEMGDTFGDGETWEKPVHTVCVNDFYIGKYEVMQREWVSIMGSNPSSFKASFFGVSDKCPVESVSWNDVQDFIGRLNRKDGVEYRLPTEAEWEYAARSGGKAEKWAGTSSESGIGDYAWYYKNSGRKIHPVGDKMPNGLGLYDMTGNVSEWVSDWYDASYYQNSPKYNPAGPSSGQKRVFRGGSWVNLPVLVRASIRDEGESSVRFYKVGFRLALSPR